MKNNSLNQADIRSLEQNLLRLMQSTLDLENSLEAESIVKASGETAEHIIDADLSSETNAKETNLRLAQIEDQKLSEIQDALARIKDGSYGVCEECDENIPLKRLQILPFTRFCVPCEELIEKEAKNRMKGHETDVDFDRPIIKKRQ